MAIAYVNSSPKTGLGSGSTVATPAISHTTGNLLVVAVRWDSTTVTVTGVADTAGNTYTSRTVKTFNGTDSVQFWYAKNITGNASNVVTATFSSSAPSASGITVDQFSGCDTTSPYDTEASGSGSGTGLVTGAFTTTTADEVIVVAGDQGSTSGTYTAGAGYTIAGQTIGVALSTEYQIVSSIQTGVTAGITSSAGLAYGIIAATFKIASGGGFTAKFRKTLSSVGTGVGKRQAF